MKILILYTYNKGLLSEFFQELSHRLSDDAYEVVNFYLKNKKEFFIQNGVEIYGEKHSGFLQNYKAIYQIIKKTKPDVVISNFSYINPAILFGKLLGVKRNIAWFHTAFGHTKPNKLKVWNKSFYLNLADVVLTNSSSLQEEMHSFYKVSKEKTRKIPFWTNITNYRDYDAHFNISKNETFLNIGCPGRLLANKNHALVIESVCHLKKNHTKPIRLYLAGEGTYKTKLETLVKKLKLDNEVVFLGLLNVHEMTAFYEAMDVVVLPSFHEAFGLVFIEAIALGTPVLVSSQFGALSFIESKKDLINMTFNPKSIDDLIEKLEPYLKSNGLSPSYFKNIYAQNFDKDIIYERIVKIILEK